MNRTIRHLHRWLSLAFVLTVLTNIIAFFTVDPQSPLAMWIGLAALVPLIPLMFSGIYMFVRPYMGGTAQHR